MFRVTPVAETGARKVSFSPDIDESYRHRVVDKIQGLIKEVEVIHEKEEKVLQKFQEKQAYEFKKKQEMELQEFMKRQKQQSTGFQTNQANDWNNLKERHTQETWKLFGRPPPGAAARPTIHNMWGEREKKVEDSRHSSPCFSPPGGRAPSEASNQSWSSMNSQLQNLSLNTSQQVSPNPWDQTNGPRRGSWDQTNGGGGPTSGGGDYWNNP